MKKHFLLILSIISLLLISCNPDGPGIFYKISVEPPLSNSSLSEKSIYKVVNDGTKTYVLAGGAVYKESGSDWDKISAPVSNTQAVSLASDGSKIYSVYDSGENDSIMYEFNGSTWISNTYIDDFDNSNGLTLVEGGTNLIFICQETDTGYTIWSYNDGFSLNQLNSSSINIPVISVAFNSGDYFIISSNTTTGDGEPEIYISDGTSSSWTANHGDFDTTQAIGGIIYDNLVNSALYLSTSTGKVYSSINNGLNWTQVSSSLDVKMGPMDIFTTTGSDNYLLIGSNGGFYEMDLSTELIVSPTSATIGSTEYLSVDLNTELVFSIMADGSNGFYIGSSNGLWYSDTNKLDLK